MLIKLIGAIIAAAGMWSALSVLAYGVGMNPEDMQPLQNIFKWMSVIGIFGVIAIGRIK